MTATTKQVTRRRKTPTKKKIIAWWKGNPALDAITDLGRQCWACQRETKRVHRCHIVPLSQRGHNTCNNLVLMCHRCHAVAPSTTNLDAFWAWMQQRWAEVLVDYFCDVQNAAEALAMSSKELEQLNQLLVGKGKSDFLKWLHRNAELYQGVLSPWTLIASFQAYLKTARRVTS